MRFYTKDECEKWLKDRSRVLPDIDPKNERFFSIMTKENRAYATAHWIASTLTFRESVLVWITEWAIWPSSENWHIYYAMRQLHGDYRELHEAPGHLFLPFEMESLASFLQIALLNGWGGYILTSADYANMFFSHDEYINFYPSNDNMLADIQARFEQSGA